MTPEQFAEHAACIVLDGEGDGWLQAGTIAAATANAGIMVARAVQDDTLTALALAGNEVENPPELTVGDFVDAADFVPDLACGRETSRRASVTKKVDGRKSRRMSPQEEFSFLRAKFG